MNIAIGGFFHESNTFNPIITGKDDFIIFERDEIYENRNSYLIAKGIIEYFESKKEYTLFPLVFAKAVPNGEIDDILYHELKEKFFRYLEGSQKIDAFVLALHGSMRVKNIGSAESDLLKSIHSKYPEVPVYCALDMHATMTEDMLKYATSYVGFKTAPHLDAYETGYHAAQMADTALSTNTKLSMGYAKINCLIAGEKSETDCEPMKSLIYELKKMEKEEDVCAASYLLGFPWADATENGVTALVIIKDNQVKADKYARYLADKFIECKSSFSFSSPSYSPEQALTLALQEIVKPVFVSDSGDNPTAGSTADNTTILRLLSTELKDLIDDKSILVAGIYDPIAVKICLDNKNKQIQLSIGGQFDTMYCKPVELIGTPIVAVSNFGLFKANIVLFKTEYFELILTSKHIGFTHVEIFQALGIDYLNRDVIIVKLGYLTEDFKEIAAKSYMALTRGCTDEVLSRLTYSKKYDLI
jgi:microcystin degradation protein MlrC